MCSILSLRRTWPARIAGAALFVVAAAGLAQIVGGLRPAIDQARTATELGPGFTFMPTSPPRPPLDSLSRARWVFGGTEIVVTAGPITPVGIYEMLRRSGLGTMGENLTVRVQDAFPPTRVTLERDLAAESRAHATMWLDAWRGSGFRRQPDRTIAHQIGVLWVARYLAGHERFWRDYLNIRGLDGDRRLWSSALWDPEEILADDYRLLFGSAAAIEQYPRHENPALADPRSVTGLRDLLATYVRADR